MSSIEIRQCPCYPSDPSSLSFSTPPPASYLINIWCDIADKLGPSFLGSSLVGCDWGGPLGSLPFLISLCNLSSLFPSACACVAPYAHPYARCAASRQKVMRGMYIGSLSQEHLPLVDLHVSALALSSSLEIIQSISGLLSSSLALGWSSESR